MEQPKKNDWIGRPNRKQIRIVFIIWLAGIILCILAMTDHFKASPFKSKNAMMIISCIVSSLVVLKIYANYVVTKSGDR